MKRSSMLLMLASHLFFFSIVFFFSTFAMAQSGKPADKCKDNKQEKIVKGVVASVGSYPSTGAAVGSDSSGSTPGDDPSVISGSINFIGDGKCAAVVTNASECKSYSVSFVVKGAKQTETSMRTIVSSSANLAPKGRKEQTFSCNKDEYNYVVELTKVK